MSRPVPGWLVAVLLGGLLVGCGAVVAVASRLPAIPQTSATTFVPVDAYRGYGSFTEGGHAGEVMIEDSRMVGLQVDSSTPGALAAVMTPMPGNVPVDDQWWWREGVVPSTFLDPTPRYRLRSITPSGVLLHGQEWGTKGIAFEPALTELPADVAAGRRWATTGVALAAPDRTLYRYRNTSAATRPEDGIDAAAGCLTVTSTTTLQPKDGAETGARTRWTETNLWCPGQGVVASEGDFRGTTFGYQRLDPTPQSPFKAEALADAPGTPGATADPTEAEISRWKHGRIKIDVGDDTFGALDGEITTGAELLTLDRAETFHVVNANGREVNTVTPLNADSFWAHGWLHPGGQITGVTARGLLVVVATADRGLYGYDYAGRLHWSTRLPDVPVVAPQVLDGHQVLTVTTGGLVSVHDGLTGRLRWQHRLANPVSTAPAAGPDTVLVSSTDGTVTALDLATGDVRWSEEISSQAATVLTDGSTAVTMGFGDLDARDLRTGTLRWRISELADTDAAWMLGSTLVISYSDETVGYDPGTGRELWRHPGPTGDALRRGDVIFLLDRDGAPDGDLVTAVAAGSDGGPEDGSDDKAGTELAHWSLGRSLGRTARLFAARDRLWVAGSDDSSFAADWIGPGPVGS